MAQNVLQNHPTRFTAHGTAAPIFVAPPTPNLTEILSAPALATLSTLDRPPLESKLSRRERKKINANSVRTLDEFLGALAEKKVQITLGEDIIVNRSIVIDYDVAINFNGHNLISEQNQSDFRLFDIHRGEVILTGEGKIFAFGTASVAIRVFGAISSGIPNYTTLTVDERIRIFAPDGSGILISANLGAAYGVTVNFSGSIIARSGICLGQGVRGTDGNLPIINIKSGSTIIADDVCAAAVEAAGLGIWRIGAAKLYGLSGIWAKFGQLTLEHTHIFAAGASILFDGPAGANISLSIRDGIYLSANDYALAGDPATLAHLSLESGEYSGGFGLLAPALSRIAAANDCHHSPEIRAAWEKFADGIPFPIDDASLEIDAPGELIAPEISDTLILPQVVHTIQKPYRPSPEPIDPPVVVATTPIVEPIKSSGPLPLTAPAAPAQPLEIIASPISLNAAPAYESTIPFAPAPILHEPVPIVASIVTPKVDPEPEPEPEPPVAPASEVVASDPDSREVLISAFTDAISSMRALKFTDYDDDFDDFTELLTQTEQVLNDPEVDLDTISAAAAELLDAFDTLQEDDDANLSDEELDQLFYHGAILHGATEAVDPEPVASITAQNIADVAEAVFDDEPTNIDEMSPTAEWSPTVTTIDELTPVSYDGPAFRFHHRVSTSVGNFCHSVSAGLQAGLAAFHSSRNDSHI